MLSQIKEKFVISRYITARHEIRNGYSTYTQVKQIGKKLFCWFILLRKENSLS